MKRVFPNIPKDKIQHVLPMKKAEFHYRLIPNLRVALDCEHCDNCMVEEIIVDVPEEFGGNKVAHGLWTNRFVCTDPQCTSQNTFKFVNIEE